MERAVERLRRFWAGPGGGAEVVHIAYPLVLAQMSFTVQTFVDRLFLTWYSQEAVAGAVTSLFTVWVFISLFLGTGEYLTTFVAQYLGAGRPRRIGPVVWQGIYFSLAAGLFVTSLTPLARPVFEAAGHAPGVMAHEISYARILMWGAFPIILMATLSTFFAGRGSTRVILAVNVLATLVNVVLDYFWIFGRGGFPRAGVAGAAWATVISQVVGALVYLAIILKKKHREAYATASGWRFERPLFTRFIRYGLPTGLQYSVEILAFAIFMMIIGRIGVVPLAASGIAFNLNMIVFMPMLGLGVGVAALVGRHLGAERPEVAERAVHSAFAMSLTYMLACGLLYVGASRLLLAPYAAGAPPGSFDEVAAIATVLLRFIALYSIFDMMNVVFAAGLKGAGDTRYPLVATLLLGLLVMLGPAWVMVDRYHVGVYAAWTAPTAYVAVLGVLMLR
ncbi:MAG TPA: MATE family efflux transporter, partial [Vicinamibacteria bacterium]|nr:MATE family efflux transporter [Vicinamibacteria bacterium]